MNLSVIIPVYAKGPVNLEFLLDLIRKLKDLGLTAEIIIADDASPHRIEIPATPELNGEEIKLVRNPIRRGPNSARNQGIQNASSENVLLLDFGDFISTELLKMSYDQLCAGGKIKLTGGNYTETRKVLFSKREVVLEIREAKFLGEICPNGSGMAFKKQTWQELGGFDENIFYGATDREFGLRVMDRFGREAIQILPASVFHYVKTSPFSNFVRSFRLSRGYVYVLNKRRNLAPKVSSSTKLKLLHFNNRNLMTLFRTEGFAFTISSLLGKIFGRLFWRFVYRISTSMK